MDGGIASGFGDTLSGIEPLSGGSLAAGNFTRFTADEMRLMGYPNNRAYPLGGSVGGQKLIATAGMQLQGSEIFFPGDLTTVLNVSTGGFLCNGAGPWSTAVAVSGAFTFPKTASMGDAFANVVQIGAGAANVVLPGPSSFGSAPVYSSAYTGVTMGTTFDFQSAVTFSVGGSGALTVSNFRNYHGKASANGATITNYVTFNAVLPTIQSGGAITQWTGLNVDAPSPTNGMPGTTTGVNLFGGAFTYTAAPNMTALNIGSTLSATLNYSLPVVPTQINVAPTFVFQQSGSGATVGTPIAYQPTIATISGTAITIGDTQHVLINPTFNANTTTANALGNQTMLEVGPAITHTSTGTFTSGAITGFQSSLTLNATGTTVTSWTAIDVPAPVLLHGTVTTAIGLYLEAQTNPLQMAMTTTGPTTGNLTSNTNVVMTMYKSATPNYFWLIAFNDGGTVRYKYLQLNGTGVTWVTGTTLPT